MNGERQEPRPSLHDREYRVPLLVNKGWKSSSRLVYSPPSRRRRGRLPEVQDKSPIGWSLLVGEDAGRNGTGPENVA